MKVLINLIVVAIIAAGGFYFYQQNKEDLDKTLDEAKNLSVESVTDAVVEKVKSVDPDKLMDLAMENKERLAEFMEENNISLDNVDIDELKSQLEDQGISLENMNLEDDGMKEKLQKMIEAIKK